MLAFAPARCAKFRAVRQKTLSQTKLKIAVTCVRQSVRAAEGVRASVKN